MVLTNIKIQGNGSAWSVLMAGIIFVTETES